MVEGGGTAVLYGGSGSRVVAIPQTWVATIRIRKLRLQKKQKKALRVPNKIRWWARNLFEWGEQTRHETQKDECGWDVERLDRGSPGRRKHRLTAWVPSKTENLGRKLKRGGGRKKWYVRIQSDFVFAKGRWRGWLMMVIYPPICLVGLFFWSVPGMATKYWRYRCTCEKFGY